MIYRQFCMKGRYHPKVDSYSTTAPFWYIVEGQGKGKSSKQTELWAVQLTVYFPWKEKWLDVHYILIHGLWPVVCLDGLKLGRNGMGKQVTKMFEEEVCGQMPLNVQSRSDIYNVKIIVSLVNAHQKITSVEENFSNQVGRITYSMETSEPLSPPPCHHPMGS